MQTKKLNWIRDLEVVISELRFRDDKNSPSSSTSTNIEIQNAGGGTYNHFDYLLPSSDGNFVFLSHDSTPIVK